MPMIFPFIRKRVEIRKGMNDHRNSFTPFLSNTIFQLNLFQILKKVSKFL